MEKPLEALARIFQFSNKFLPMVTEPISGEEWFQPPGREGNYAYWILGHVATARRSILRNLGQPLPEEPWEEAFRKGSKPGERIDGPSPAELIGDFQKSGEILCKILSNLSREDVKKPYQRKMPDGSEDILGVLHFLFFHEAQHLGQLGLIRRILGKPGYI